MQTKVAPGQIISKARDAVKVVELSKLELDFGFLDGAKLGA